MPIATAFIVGFIFGCGLIVAEMTNPAKVQGFLDLAGSWDPSLGIVMGSAVMLGLVAFRVAGRQQLSLLGEAMRMPTATRIDRRLVLGSLVFGIGWGLAGLCPGPALVAAASGNPKVLTFTGAMLAGMIVFEVLERYGRTSQQHPA